MSSPPVANTGAHPELGPVLSANSIAQAVMLPPALVENRKNSIGNVDDCVKRKASVPPENEKAAGVIEAKLRLSPSGFASVIDPLTPIEEHIGI